MNIMNSNKKNERFKQKLIDAQDGLLSEEELQRLEKNVKEHEPALWEDFIWSMEQQRPNGVLDELAAMGREEPDTGAIHRFHARREAELAAGSDLEGLVWSWFRRYVLTTGLVLLFLFSGLYMGENGVSEANGQEEIQEFLGWNEEELSVPDYWLYED